MDNWSQIKTNLRSCFAALTSLTSNKVIWYDPDESPPAYPYVTLRLTEEQGLVRQDQKDELILPSRDSGSEQFTVIGRRKFTVTCKLHGGANPTSEPIDTLLAAQLAIGLPAMQQYLKKRQIYTLAIDTANLGEEYIVYVEGIPVCIQAGSSSTESIRNQLIDAIAANEYIPFKVEAAVAANELLIFGRPGVQFLVQLSDGESRMTLTNSQSAVDITYFDDDGVQDVSELVEGTYLERARIDVHFSTIVRTTINLPTIESVEFTDMSSGETYLINT